MDKTKIDWADSTWNPVTGCRHGCEYCYARSIAHRFCKSGLPDIGCNELYELDNPVRVGGKIDPYPFGFEPTFHKYRLDNYKNRTGRNIFVCSMGELFGEWVPDEWTESVFAACREAPQHNYLFLTKNYLRACDFRFEVNWWIGRSITHDEPCGSENKNLYLCYGVPKSVEPIWKDHPNTFISIEPIHGPIPDLPYYAHKYGYKWVIVGAETGNRKDKVIPKREWIDKIAEDCALRNVPLFMKESLRELMGSDFKQEYPVGLMRAGK